MLLKLLLLLVVLAPVPAPPRPDPLGVGYLGVVAAPVDQATGLDLTIQEVRAGGPAARAGLRVGDTLVTVGPFAPKRFAEVRDHVRGLRPGTRLRVEVSRGGRTLPFTVAVGDFPPDQLERNPFDPDGRPNRLLPPPPPNR